MVYNIHCIKVPAISVGMGECWIVLKSSFQWSKDKETLYIYIYICSPFTILSPFQNAINAD